jgi:DNA-binding SARP family transcriptional activator
VTSGRRDAPIRFAILGPLQVQRSNEELDLGSRKERLLLGLLLVHANRAVSIDRIIDALWAEHAPRSAAPTVHTLVSRLRRVLDPERRGDTDDPIIVREPSGYVLRLGDADFDAPQFENLVGDARMALASGDASLAVGQFDDALALWRGEVLGGLGVTEFVHAEAARLDEVRLSASEDRLEAL